MEVAEKPDIESKEDVAALVREFYTKVYQDEILRPMFADVAKVDLEQHLPKMNSFWNTILLGEQSYRGNPMMVHHHLNSLKPLNECHFIRWFSLFCMTVDGMFVGPTADHAKDAAHRINTNINWSLQRSRGHDTLGRLADIES